MNKARTSIDVRAQHRSIIAGYFNVPPRTIVAT
jgi:hypothetical protein